MSRREQIEQMLALSPDDSFLLFALAKEHEKAGNDKGALDTYLKLKEVNADYVGLYFHLAKTYERIDQDLNAWNTYTEGIAIAKRLGEKHAMNELAGARLELGDEEDFL
ncbi:MAG: tetratricopeptide repeat protein [Bacteroidota bacterium]